MSQNFEIVIHTSNPRINGIEGRVSYFGGVGGTQFYDGVRAQRGVVTIAGSRKRISADNLFITKNSTYLKAVSKSMLLCYFKFGAFEILALDARVDDLSCKVPELVQNFKASPKYLDKSFAIPALEQGVESSEVAMTSAMQLVLGASDPILEFDYAWRAFNRLAGYKSGKAQDFEMLKYIRREINSSPERFPRAMAYAATVDQAFLEDRWIIAMINNNIPRASKNEAKRVVEFLGGFDDYRVCGALAGKASCKKKILKDAGLWEGTIDRLDNVAESGLKKDADVLRLLILKYCYYLRNKYFHGERWPSEFIFSETANAQELGLMAKPLTLLCYDLLEAL
ncbi:hypothetical protein AAEX63_01970 [Luteococcus sp. H138]|uniref:hypothetical protein n=1 Tax=unclassified Luteococcus TaxID=2639923 RepID=UPI00313BFB6C